MQRSWWRPRFTIRTLFLVMLCAAVFLVVRRSTQKYGKPQLQNWLINTNESCGEISYVCPLILRETNMYFDTDRAGNNILETNKHYYLWLFGSIVRMPYDRNYTDVIPQNLSDADFDRLYLKRK